MIIPIKNLAMKVELDSEVFSNFAICTAILVAKMLLMSAFTAKHRLTRKVFSNPEDVVFDRKGHAKIKTDDPEVERVRRAHQNDLENIMPFIPIAAIFCFTSPDLTLAKSLFQVFTGTRVLHTIFYLWLRTPRLRFLACFVGYCINFYMVYAVINHFLV